VEPKRRLLEAELTKSPEAYDLYLRGVQYSWQTMEEDECLAAIDMFQRALEKDPGFAAAYVGLAGAHLVLYWYGHDRSENRLRLAKAAIDSAQVHDPDLPAAQIALAGYYYWGLRDYDRALEEAEALKRRLPSSEMAYTTTAAIKRRQGRWEEALADLSRRSMLNPTSGLTYMESAVTLLLLRRYDEAGKQLDLAISLTPQISLAYEFILMREILAGGDVQRARTVIEGARGQIGEATIEHYLFACDIMDRQFERALSRLDSMLIPAFGDSATYYAQKAGGLDLLGDSTLADVYHDSARVFLEALPVSGALKYQRDMRLAYAYAGLGRREEALQLMRDAVLQCPIESDAFDGSEVLRVQAEVNAELGNHETAIDQFEYLLSIPSFLSVDWLKADPRLDPLRENPRFQELLERGHTVF
jgi:serine/threonine-protein kinase